MSDYLSKMTVKELRVIADRMELKVPSRAKKIEIVAFLDSEIVLAHAEAHHLNTPRAMFHTDSPLVIDTEECPMNHRQFTVWYNRHGGIDSFDVNKALASDHSEALDMNAAKSVETFEIDGMTFTGLNAKLMQNHMEMIRRYNPSLKRDKDGFIILTPAQRRRIHKRDRSFGKEIGFFKEAATV